MWIKKIKIWLAAGAIALVSACGSQDSGSSVVIENKLSTGISANTKSADFGIPAPAEQIAAMRGKIGTYFGVQSTFSTQSLNTAESAVNGQVAVTPQASGAAKPVFRFYNNNAGAHFYTMSVAERDYIVQNFAFFSYEGVKFYAYSDQDPALSPVYRFYNKITATHFYTVDLAERDHVIATWPEIFNYEGVAWHASTVAAPNWVPIFRFYNSHTNTHFYTASAAEKDYIIATWNWFVFEGTAYYVRQSDSLELSLLAGGLGGNGNLDGVGTAARFSYSNGVAVDAAGNAFVAEYNLIRKVTPAGKVSTFAGNQTSNYLQVDGTGTAASFQSISGLTIDSVGNLFVTDLTTIRKITPSAVVSTFAGSSTTSSALPNVDGTGIAARFRQVSSITIDSANNLYVADTGNYTIRKISPGAVVTTIAGDVTGTVSTTPLDGPALTAKFVRPTDVTVDTANNIYVADNRQIRKISSSGVVSTLAGDTVSGAPQDGTGTAARFTFISDIKVDAAGNIFVADIGTRSIRKVSPVGAVTTFAGTPAGTYISSSVPSLDGTGTAAVFSRPAALALDASGNLLMMDSYIFRKITPTAVVSTIAGKNDQPGVADGTGAAARLRSSPMVFDSTGNMFVLNNQEGLVRKITQAGVVTTFAGGGSFSGNPTGDGTGTGAAFTYPLGLAIDSANNIYVAGAGVVRKVTPAAVVTTMAGVISLGFGTAPVDATGAAARFSYLSGGIAVDSTGNLFVSDGKTIRKITQAGVVTTFAGSATYTGGVSLDGNGTAAQFVSVGTIAINSTGTLLFVSDAGKIRKITPSADVSTYAGALGYGNVDGDLSVAKFGYGAGIAFDASNNMYLADGSFSVIRKITPAGQVSTVVGTSGRRGVVEGLLSGVANLAGPQGVAVYGGMLYTSDENSILKVNGLP